MTIADLFDDAPYVTVELTPLGDQGDVLANTPRLTIAEHRLDKPTRYHGTEGWIPLATMQVTARQLARQLGVKYVEPTHPLAIELLSLAEAA